MKICTKCHIEKPESEFNKNGKYFRGDCKICGNESSKKRNINNPNKRKEYGIKYREKNKEQIKEKNHQRYLINYEKLSENKRRWRVENPEKKKAGDKRYREQNIEKEKERHLKYRTLNKDKVNDGIKKWNANNPEKVRERARRSSRKRRATTMGRLNNIMSSGICKSLCGGKAGRHWESLVGYNVKDLIKHIERKFLPGMKWENYGKWHIDHKIPKTAFNFEKPEHIDFQRCWALSNLQPMWSIENLKKHDKLYKPFQPSLAI